jgi:hypothetical protein
LVKSKSSSDSSNSAQAHQGSSQTVPNQVVKVKEKADSTLNTLNTEVKVSSDNREQELVRSQVNNHRTLLEKLQDPSYTPNNVSAQCVSEIKEAGMATVSAIADANSATLEQLEQTKRQIEQLESKLAQLDAKFDAREQKSRKGMNAFIEWAGNITQMIKLV